MRDVAQDQIEQQMHAAGDKFACQPVEQFRVGRRRALVAEVARDAGGGLHALLGAHAADHDLDAWDALPVEEQQRAIGREKLSDVELADDVKPANSHVALVDASGLRAVYRKLHLFEREREWFTPGDLPLATHRVGAGQDTVNRVAVTPSEASSPSMLERPHTPPPQPTYKLSRPSSQTPPAPAG